MYQKILIPLDGSVLAEKALPHAESLAMKYNATLVLLSVVNPPVLAAPPQTEDAETFTARMDALRAEMENYLTALKGRFRKLNIKVMTFVGHGPVVQEIAALTESQSVDLVIIASHGHTGLKKVFFGSVATGALNRIEQPLLVIRSSSD